MRDVIIETLASNDLAESIAFYDQRQEGVGMEFLAEVRAMLRIIAENPRLYPVFHRKTRKALLKRFPHVILYRFDENTVVVVGVMHCSRDPRRFRSRTR